MSLTNYIETQQTKLFEELGVIFAFSPEQFNRQKKEGTIYIQLGAGLLVPKHNLDNFLNRHENIVSNGIAQDLAENGKRNIILRELANHECYYTGDYSDCVEALEDYGITEDDVREVFHGSR